MAQRPSGKLPGFPQPYEVVAIGASTGGLKALSILLKDLPVDLPVPILVVQHLTAEVESRHSAILSQRTVLRVENAVEGGAMQAGVVYLACPGSHLLIGADRTMTMTRTPKVRYVRPSIDSLFGSLAAVYGAGAIGVVLTGYGRDGSDGLGAIRRAGGLTIAQTPDASEAASMPRAAIETGAVDLILPLEEIAPSIMRVLVAGGERVEVLEDPI